MCSQTMTRIIYNYMNYCHDVQKELEKRKKAKKEVIETIMRVHHFSNENNDDIGLVAQAV